MTSGLNVFLIVVDQWRAEALGCMGARHALTPNLDRLAARGRLFGKHFAQGTPCAPARASLLTGRYVMNHRVVTNGVPLGAGHTHLARELRNAGYEPTLIGYTTTTPDPALVARTDARFKKMGDIPSEWRVAAHFEYGDYPEYLSWVHQRNPRYRSLKATEMWQANPPSERPTDAPIRAG